MELKDWLPIGGIVLGWILSQIASYYRDTREERKLLSITMSTLLFVYFDRLRYRHILSILNTRLGDKLEQIYKMDASPEEKLGLNNCLLVEIEKARIALLIDHPITEERSNASLVKALESISQVNAIISYKTRSLIEDDYLYKNIDLSDLLNEPLVYLKSYESLLGSVESFNNELRNLILTTAFKHGLFCFLQTLIFLWHEKSKFEECDHRANQFFDAFEAANLEERKNNINKDVSNESNTCKATS